jgi:hypothetical protein
VPLTRRCICSADGQGEGRRHAGLREPHRRGRRGQWNDLYTWVDNRKLYNFAVRVYKQMWQDTAVPQQFVEYSTGKDLLGFRR